MTQSEQVYVPEEVYRAAWPDVAAIFIGGFIPVGIIWLLTRR